MRFLAACLAFLMALPAMAETYVLTDQKLSIDMPDDWPLVSAKNMAQMVLDSDFGSEMKAQAQSEDPNLLVAVVETWPPIGVVPGIQLKQYPGRVSDKTQGLQNVIAALSRNARNFEVLTQPTDTRIGDFDAAFIVYRYDVAIGGADLTVQEKFWLAPHGDMYLVISSGHAPDAPASVAAQIDQAANTLSRLP